MTFFKKAVEYVKNAPIQAAVIIGLAAALIVVCVALAVSSSKRKKAKLKAEQAALHEKALKAKSIETDMETELERAPAPVEDKKDSAPIQPKAEQPPAVKKTVSTRKTEVKTSEKPAPVKTKTESKQEATSQDLYEEGEVDKVAKYSGKWTICRVVTDTDAKDADEMYFFELHASNGEKLLASEEYTTYNGALRGIETHKTNILKDNFKITLSKKGDYIFKLLSGKNMLLCMGENYATKARCESAIESAKRFAKTAVIDENIQDHVIKVPIEDEDEVLPPPDGYNGKWIISSQTADGEQVFYFELFANNGEKLLSSEEYTTYTGAVNGIRTHQTNIEKNNFRISLTKRGDYIYKLLNGNGQLLCLGEHYKTKRRCLNAVESVKRFAMNSPVLTDPNNK